MKRYLALVLVTMIAASGCFKISTSTTPTNSTSTLLGGIWVTIESVPGVTADQSCTGFTWAVTEFNGSTGSGTFSATCFGNVAIAGTASGTINGTSITWSANATATMPGVPVCPISMSGVATIETDRIRIPYTGTTCLGTVSGTETVKK